MGMREEAMKEMARREMARRQGAMNDTPNIIEEMHEGISAADRAIVKNLSTSPEKSASYLKKHNPQLDTRVWDGRVLVKGKQEKEWRVLDPDTGIFSSDILNDIGDVGYDVASGVAQALALPAAGIVGSGLAGAGAEALRQGLGSVAGIEDNINVGDIALTGAIGAAVPAAGKAIAPAVSKVAGAGKKLVSGLTEANADDVGVFVNKSGALDDILQSDTGFTDSYNRIIKEVSDKEKIFKNQINKQFDELKKSGVEVDITGAKAVYDDNLARLKSLAQGGSKADEALYEAMKKERDDIFSRNMPTTEIVTKSTDFSGSPSVSDTTLFPASGETRNIGQPYKKWTDHMPREATSTVNRTPKDGGLMLTSDVAEKVAPKGRVITGRETVVDDVTLNDLLSGKQRSRGLTQDMPSGQDIERVMGLRQRLAARANFKNKTDMQKSIDAASMSEGLAARGYGELGTAIDDVANKIGSKQAREQFKNHVEFVGDIAKNFKDANSLETFMKAATKGNRKVIAEKLGRIDKKFGTNISEEAKVISTAQALKGGQGSGTIVDTLRPKSVLEMIGAATGAKLAWASGQPSLIPVTLAAGAAVGRKLGSIKAARNYVNFIVDVEGKALGLEKAAQDLLKKQLYKSVTGEAALRETIKASKKMTEDRG